MRPPFFIIIFICTCACFYFAGYILYADFFELFLPAVDAVKFSVDMETLEGHHNTFGFVCALIPFCTYLTWQLTPLYTGDKRTFSGLIIGMCIFLAVYIRYKMLTKDLTGWVQSASDMNTSISYPFAALNYEYYIGGGLLAGCIISYLAFHNTLVRRPIFKRDM